MAERRPLPESEELDEHRTRARLIRLAGAGLVLLFVLLVALGILLILT